MNVSVSVSLQCSTEWPGCGGQADLGCGREIGRVLDLPVIIHNVAHDSYVGVHLGTEQGQRMCNTPYESQHQLEMHFKISSESLRCVEDRLTLAGAER